jgi:hypothetical protein
MNLRIVNQRIVIAAFKSFNFPIICFDMQQNVIRSIFSSFLNLNLTFNIFLFPFALQHFLSLLISSLVGYTSKHHICSLSHLQSVILLTSLIGQIIWSSYCLHQGSQTRGPHVARQMCLCDLRHH